MTSCWVVQVHEIALQTTTFIKWDGSRVVLPNSYLFANILTNMTRSNEKAETFKARLISAHLQPGRGLYMKHHRSLLEGGEGEGDGKA